jgi:hypothetical protein
MSKAMKVPDHYLGALVAPTSGNTLLTQEVVNAAGALLQNLQANGCSRSPVGVVSTFQSAYNNAGLAGALSVDGQYGPNTQSALQAVLNATQSPPQAAPANCFPELGPPPAVPHLDAPQPSPITPVLPPGPPAPPNNTNVTVTGGTSNTVAWIIGGAIVAAAAIGGWAWYSKGGGKQMMVRRGARRKLRRIKRSRRR